MQPSNYLLASEYRPVLNLVSLDIGLETQAIYQQISNALFPFYQVRQIKYWAFTETVENQHNFYRYIISDPFKHLLPESKRIVFEDCIIEQQLEETEFLFETDCFLSNDRITQFASLSELFQACAQEAKIVVESAYVAYICRNHLKFCQPIFMHNQNGFFAVTDEILNKSRDSFFLYEGEQFNPHIVIDILNNSSLPIREKFTKPLISIIVPVYDRDIEILRLTDSICKQSYSSLEVIFVCNGSPPNTKEAIEYAKLMFLNRKIRLHVLEFSHSFGSATIPRDIGSRFANGQLLCYLDSDDYLDPCFFDYFLINETETNIFYYCLRKFINKGRVLENSIPYNSIVGRLKPEEEIDLEQTLLKRGNVFNNSGIIISKQVFSQVQGINHTLHYAEDYYLWLRCSLIVKQAVCFEGVVNITLHPSNNEISVASNDAIELAKQLYKENFS